MPSPHSTKPVAPSVAHPTSLPSEVGLPPPVARKLNRTAGRGGKTKGAGYERELANYLTAHLAAQGFAIDVSRMPLSGGGRFKAHGLAGAADLTGLPGLHVEAKRTERLNAWAAIAQASRSKTATASPEAVAVITRRNKVATGSSLIVLPLDHFLPFYEAWLTAQGFGRN